MKKMNKKGFTIVELSIVIAVVAILSAVLIPTFSGIVNKAKDSAALQNAKNAYTEYISTEIDYAEDETTDGLNMIYEESSKRFVIVKAGELQDTVYETKAAAEAALGCVEANAEAGTEKNYSVGADKVEGFFVYTIN